MSGDATDAVRQSLERGEIHEAWESDYRSAANERFYEAAFDMMLAYAGAPAGTVILDVGCGPGYHALRLARRGYRVRAVDFSPFVLDLARENVSSAGLQEQIEVGKEDMLALSFPDASFERILCWGVLMHIPEVERAIAELSRVLAPGGKLIVSEGNMRSLEGATLRAVRRVLRRRKDARRSSAGIEHWKETPAGPLMTRHADIDWTITAFAAHGVQLVERLPEQFTEAYCKLPAPLARAAHRLNRLCLHHVRSARLAANNILILTK